MNMSKPERCHIITVSVFGFDSRSLKFPSIMTGLNSAHNKYQYEYRTKTSVNVTLSDALLPKKDMAVKKPVHIRRLMPHNLKYWILVTLCE
jgi:hypothetical protein